MFNIKILNDSWLKYLALVIAGAICLFAFAPYHFSCLIGISILILLYVVNKQANTLSRIKCIGYGYLYSWAFFMAQIYWIYYSIYYVIHGGLFVAATALVVFSAFLATYGAIAIAFYIRIKSQSVLFNSLFLFPSIWVFFEWIRGWFFGGYSWSDFGYTQVDNAALRGYFSVLGEYGVSWLTVSLVGAVLILIKYAHSVMIKTSLPLQRDFRLVLLYTTLILFLGTFLGSIQYTIPYGSRTSIALIQGNISADTKWSEGENLRVYAKAVKETKADLVMLPETAIAQFERNLPKGYLDGLAASANANGASLVVGIPKIIDKKNHYVNTATLVTAPGQPYYAKYHLVPFGEYIPLKWLFGWFYKFLDLPLVDFTSGAENQPPMVAAGQKLAFNICFENGFGSELINNTVKSTLMVNISDMVWYGTTVAMDQHLQLSQARALENQRYFVQVTNTSITAIVNPNGEIQSRLPVFKRDVLRDYVQGRIGQTPFEKYGNWPVISFSSLVIMITLLRRRFQR